MAHQGDVRDDGGRCEASNFVCRVCGGLVSEARRQVHYDFWCTSAGAEHGDSSGSDAGGSGAGGGGGSRNGEASQLEEVRRLLSPQYADQMTVTLSIAPNVILDFAQNSAEALQADNADEKISGGHDSRAATDHATGGQLWWSESVLAEVIAAAVLRPESSANKDHLVANSMGLHLPKMCSGAKVLSLGSGSAPVSAYVSAACGWQVLCTDLSEVLPLGRQNAERNRDALERVAASLGNEQDAQTTKERIKFAPLRFGSEIPTETCRWIDHSGGAVELILCSDCVWQEHRHQPLLQTLTELLRPGNQALLAFQARERDEFRFFDKLPYYGLKHEKLDIADIVRRVAFPSQFNQHGDPTRVFFVYRLWR